jgi:hypothetical protein
MWGSHRESQIPQFSVYSHHAAELPEMSMEVESQDVIRLVLQFLKEHNLNDAMKALQRESGVALNTVDSVEHFASDIRNGKWDSVLAQTAALKLPGDKLVSYVDLWAGLLGANIPTPFPFRRLCTSR